MKAFLLPASTSERIKSEMALFIWAVFWQKIYTLKMYKKKNRSLNIKSICSLLHSLPEPLICLKKKSQRWWYPRHGCRETQRLPSPCVTPLSKNLIQACEAPQSFILWKWRGAGRKRSWLHLLVAVLTLSLQPSFLPLRNVFKRPINPSSSPALLEKEMTQNERQWGNVWFSKSSSVSVNL